MAVSREVLQFQSNLRKTSLGVKFAKTLFENPQSLTPKQIANVLIALGFKVPSEILMTAQIAQTIAAGKAIISTAEALGNGEALTSADVSYTSAAVKQITSLLQQNGMIDDDTASILQIGTDTALLVSSAGCDVGAWIALSLDLSSAYNTKAGLADQLAAKDMIQKYKAQILPQFKVVGSTFQDFQTGNIGIFGLITKIAVEAPNLWPQAVGNNSLIKQLFPDIALIPVVSQQITGHGSDELWGEWPWGGRYVVDRWDAEEHLNVQSVGGNVAGNIEAASAFMWSYLIGPWTAVYQAVNGEIVSNKHSSIMSTALLSLMVGGGTEISDTLDYAGLLAAGRLTPYDLKEKTCLNSIVQTALDADAKNMNQIFTEAGISTGYENPGVRAFYNKKVAGFKWVDHLQKAGNIDDFLKVPLFYDALKKFFQFPQTSFETPDAKAVGKYSGRAWRNLNNYMSVIHLIDLFKDDPYLKNTKFAQSVVSFMPTAKEFEAEFKRIQGIAVVRSINLLSDSQVSLFLNAPHSKVSKVGSYQGATVWRAS